MKSHVLITIFSIAFQVNYGFILNHHDNAYEVVYLPEISSNNDNNEEEALVSQDPLIDYTFFAFERPINLKLARNHHLIAPNFKSFLNDGTFTVETEEIPLNCHYLHRGDDVIAAISNCHENGAMQGLILLGNDTLEIQPLIGNDLDEEALVLEHSDENLKGIPHIIKRASFPNNNPQQFLEDFDLRIVPKRQVEAAISHKPGGGLTVELAMFFDEAAYKIFSPYMGHNTKQLQDMLLAYLNGVQALYHHPSLGKSIELALVRLEIMKNQPKDLPHYGGERGKLLDSFCAYQDTINTEDDDDPDHWDMALYVSGLDFFAYENGRKSGVTMGLASVGGVCLGKYNCIIAELGTTNVFGKPYPSAGFNSVYILAHEIGHNLGMHHDSLGNSCSKEGYVMSPSRGTSGETKWSRCSAEIMVTLSSWAHCLRDSGKSRKDLDHSKFLDSPGRVYTAKKQCEVLLRDKDAVTSPGQDPSTICYSLQCKTPHRSGYYFAGPALDGTQCGDKKYCFGGDCVERVPPKPVKIVKGGWGAWKLGECTSGCIQKSRGFQTKRRKCNNPPPVNTDEGCDGSSVEFGICKDDKMCRSGERVSIADFASERCREFSKVLPELDHKGRGLQAPHEDGRVWMGCAVFCKRADSGSFYTPRIELNDLGISPYFPDGTWCHNDGIGNYYCLHHHCLPENFQFTKTSPQHDSYEEDKDILFSQNAHPFSVISPELKSYFTLNSDGKPMKTELKPHEMKHSNGNDEDWETDDYIEIPELKERYQDQSRQGTDYVSYVQ